MRKKFDFCYLLLIPAVLRVTFSWFTYRTSMSLVFNCIVLWCVIMWLKSRPVNGVRKLDKWFWFSFFSLAFFTFLHAIYSLFGAAGYLMPLRRVKCGVYYLSFLFIPYLTFRYGKLLEGKFLIILAMCGFSGTALLTKRAANITGGIDLSRTTVIFADQVSIEDEMNVVENRILGVASYEVIYQAAFIVGLCLIALFFFKNKIKMAICGLMLIVLIYSIKMSGLGTPSFTMFIGLGLALLWIITRSRKTIITSGVILCIGLWVMTFYPKFYSPLSSLFSSIADGLQENSALQVRFATLSDAFSGDTSSYGFLRYRKQEYSWNTFTNYPIFGAGVDIIQKEDARIGHHSLLFDAMGQFGLFGLCSYFLFIIFIMRFFHAIIRLYGFEKRVIIMPTVYYITFVFASIANLFAGFFPIGYFIPFLWLLLDRRSSVSFRRVAYK